jgi:uncharacterized Rossmann fold enzyme
MKRYEQLTKLVAFCRPRKIIEIGAHKADRALLMCREALKHNEKVHYIGYDLFDEATPETDAREMNGKGSGSLVTCQQRLDALRTEFEGFTYELVAGDTRTTLHGTDLWADFVFIDGGHSVETIRGDYEAVKGSRVIAFDDYYSGPIDTNQFGCNAVLAGIDHEILPIEDRIKGGAGVQIAVIGWSSKWAKAIARCVKDEGHKTVTVWRPGHRQEADLVCMLNAIDRLPDADVALEAIRKLVKKRLFFAIKATPLQPLSWWRTTMERYFQILEWFDKGDEVCGTGMPLFVVGEWNAKGVLDDDKRFDQTVANCKVVSKRVPQNPEDNGRTAIIACYGPSLTETWPQIATETRFTDNADVFSVSGAHDFLVRRHIVPDFHIECDPRAHKAANLNNPQQGTKYYIASCCHPALIDKLKDCDISLWHLCNGQASFRIMEEIETEKDQFLVTGGGSVGLRSISLAYALGYRKFSIYGMDCSFASADWQWAGPHKGKKQQTIEVRCGDKSFITSPVLVTYSRHFFDTMQRATGATFTLYGDGLLQEMCKLSMAKQKEQAA